MATILDSMLPGTYFIAQYVHDDTLNAETKPYGVSWFGKHSTSLLDVYNEEDEIVRQRN